MAANQEVTTNLITQEERDQREEITTNLIGQAERAVIESDRDVEKVGDLIKILKATSKKWEAKRTDLVKPLNDTVKKINLEFKQSTERLTKAIDRIQGLATIYVREQERIQKAEQDRLRKVAEDAALEEARLAQEAADLEAKNIREAAEKAADDAKANGNEEEAQAITQEASDAADAVVQEGQQEASDVVDQAATASNIAQHTSGGIKHHGDFGSTVHSRKTRKYKINDVRKIPVQFLMLDDAEIKGAMKKNKLAAELEAANQGLKGKEKDAFISEAVDKFTIDGLEFFDEINAAVR